MTIVKKIVTLLFTREIIMFFVGGISAFVLDLAILTFQTAILNFRAELFNIIFVPNIISTTIALVYSFYFQKFLTFKDNTKNQKKQLPLFFAVSIFNILMFGGLVFGFLIKLNLPIFFSKIISTTFQMCSSFLFYKFLVFKQVR